MRKLFFGTIIFGTTLLFFNSCSTTKKTTTTTTGTVYTYTNDVKLIIDENCGTKCHSAEKKADGIDLSNYASVKKESLKGDLLGAIQHVEGLEPMPKKADKLSNENIQIIASWINSGAPE
ncbi:MAG TPA: hypothetical protein VFM99_07960 [Chitinophagales bacterium]|nr:hypothetical protein [Chitinophagales bacterium]